MIFRGHVQEPSVNADTSAVNPGVNPAKVLKGSLGDAMGGRLITDVGNDMDRALAVLVQFCLKLTKCAPIPSNQNQSGAALGRHASGREPDS
jgi:hypothetical protein